VLTRNGSVELQMHLNPADLGRVQINLVTRGDEVHGQVLVANDAVRHMVESQMSDLRQRLEAAGVNVQRFDVSTNAGSTGSGNQTAYQNGTAAPEYTPRTAVTVAPAATQARISRLGAGSIDVTV